MSVLRRTYEIRSWRTWDAEVDSFAVDFKRAFGFFPCILLASSPTLARIDMAADREHLVDRAGVRPQPEEFVSIDSFSGDGYSLAFCLDERLPSKALSLVFDIDPDGGEPLPDEDTPLGDHANRRRA